MTTILLTGATSGLGRWLVDRLATEPGVRLVLHGRDEKRLQDTVDAATDAGADAVGHVADLASLGAVARLAHAVLDTEPRLDVLVNNAGVGFGTERVETVDGMEQTLAVDYLAPVLLTERLWPLLATGGTASRVVQVGSLGQALWDFDDVQTTRHWSGSTAYRRAKLALASYARDLGERAGEDGPRVSCIHPATFMATNMTREAGISPLSTLADGGPPTLDLILGRLSPRMNGAFFDGHTETDPHPDVLDPQLRARLRAVTHDLLTGTKAGGLVAQEP